MVKIFIAILFLFSFPYSVQAAVVINEYLPNPSGPQSEDTEWIELYNTDSNPVDITGWILSDSGDNSYTIASSSSTIAANGYAVFEKSVTNISLNNSGDSVRLLNASSTVVDSHSYSSTSEDVSIGRTVNGGGSFTTCQTATRGSANSCALPAATNSPFPSATRTPTLTRTPTSANVSSPTNTPLIKTPTASVRRSPTKSPTITPAGETTPTLAETTISPTPTEIPEASAGAANRKPLIITLVFVSSGLLLLAGVYAWKKIEARKQV